MKMAALLLDIGNTSVTAGLTVGGRIRRVSRIATHPWNRARTERFLRAVCGAAAVRGAIMASVVPGVTEAWYAAARRRVGAAPLQVTHRSVLNIGIDYPRPATIGADRLVDACGAMARHGAPVIVADFGTALTIDVVSPAGNFVGGVIAPGLSCMTEYLADRTALLPRIRAEAPAGVLGRSTRAAMQSGVVFGYRGLVRELTAELRRLPGLRRARLCATGGYARQALRGSGLACSLEPDLTLFGLSIIYALNAPPAQE